MKTLWWSCLLAATLATPVWATDRYPVEVVRQPHQSWQFEHLNAYKDSTPTQVTGRMTAALLTGLPQGHIDVAAYSPDGKLIAATTSRYFPGLLTHTTQIQGGVWFSAEFDQPLPADALIKVAFHASEPVVPVKPVHRGNIAR